MKEATVENPSNRGTVPHEPQVTADAKARADAAIARAASSTTYKDLKEATAGPGITEIVSTDGRRFAAAGIELDQQSLAPHAPAPLDDVSLSTRHISHRIGTSPRPTMQQHANAADRTGGGVTLATTSGDTTRETELHKRIKYNVGEVRTAAQTQGTNAAATTAEVAPDVTNQNQ